MRAPPSRHAVRWSIGMTAGGLAIALVVGLVTGSLGWALVGLVAAGPVLTVLAGGRRAR